MPESAWLKINKAMYGTRVFVNGKLAGDHLPCFTPGWFDVRELLAPPGEPNELVVRVGIRESLPKAIPDGWDPEKPNDDHDYVPGIFDSVTLILSGLPRVVNVQAVPDVEGKAVRVVAEIEGRAEPGARVRFLVSEAAGGQQAGAADAACPAGDGRRTLDVRIPIRDCQLWSPEHPFLYHLDVSTPGDTLRTRFGVRSFRLNHQTGYAELNGRPYFLRGTTVCAYRFFTDPKRADLPWREDWVRKLHRTFKDMHWNSMRYTIGFPPEQWYRIADEEGLLIQDEFPLWCMNSWPKEITAKTLVEQYTEWMRERWNHPSVVIWDAQNETVADASGVAHGLTETGKAIVAVRGLDLSNRPWDNGWDAPVAPGDSYEAHPYVFGYRAFQFADFATLSGAPGEPGGLQCAELPNTHQNPIIINEYGWGHLRRDGELTDPSFAKFYQDLPWKTKTIVERQALHARVMAAETEFWRARRRCAGVLHFCGLCYAKPHVPTSDHFVDIEKLNLEPYFAKYVRDAFAPVGLMIDFWGDRMLAGRQIDGPRRGDQRSRRGLRLYGPFFCHARRETGGGTGAGLPARQAWHEDVGCPRDGSRRTRPLSTGCPAQPAGATERRKPARLRGGDRGSPERGAGVPKKATASSSLPDRPASNAVDGKGWTRWSSEPSDPQWLMIDLGEPKTMSRVWLCWEGISNVCYAKEYRLQVSDNAAHWTNVYHTDAGGGGIEDIRFPPIEKRYIRLLATKRSDPKSPIGYTLFEFKVYR